MSGFIFAALGLLLSLTVTYFFCLRPMRQGRCAMVGNTLANEQSVRRDEAEIARLREEVAVLRGERLTLNSG
ncbi:hypothetical protein [Arthrobacter sp. H14]|uniref:hypothetical protein n=1 Tax=Arthrobacter sp. H14 TaxID=1312959 RepID=UPI000478EF0F|nr:hypothetical protein [Arthrobacter sp. H14]